MRVGIVRYPGSNCNNDMRLYFKNSFYIWHKEEKLLESIELLVIPGGFAFGDRYYEKENGTEDRKYDIEPGKMAIESPVTKIILEAVKRKIPILGVGNGFQILVHLGLLPGKLLLNLDKKFTCKSVKCILYKKFTGNKNDISVEMQVANSYGRFLIDTEEYLKMKTNNQIIMTYSDENEYNNGSIYNIAGICDKERLIFGMIPQPERTFEQNIYNTFNNIITENMDTLKNKFKVKIGELMKNEHITYKSSEKYLNKLYTTGPNVLLGPGENAGIVDIGHGYCIALKMKTQNYPLIHEPYQGAATSVGGTLRNIFSMGARPIAIMDFLRFGTDKNSNRLLQETIRGISDYGNCAGIANIGGDLYRHEIYNKNPLLNVACIGIVKTENIVYGNALNENSVIIYVGSKTGLPKKYDDAMKDGIQKCDPLLERLLMEACSEISNCNIFESSVLEGMQSIGKGGLFCASLKLIQRGRQKTGKNLGCVLNTDKVPVKHQIDSCDTLISETQERMLLVVNKDKQNIVFSILEKWDLEHSVIGYVNETGEYSVINNNIEIMYREPIVNFTDVFENWVLKHNKVNNIIMKKTKYNKLWEQYDTTIGGRTISGPQQCKSYAILDIYEINKELCVVWGEDVKTMYDKMKYLKAEPLAIVNCLNFGHPRDVMGDFSDIIDKLASECEKYKVPIVGGNVSLYNATDDVSIQATPILVMIGIK